MDKDPDGPGFRLAATEDRTLEQQFLAMARLIQRNQHHFYSPDSSVAAKSWERCSLQSAIPGGTSARPTSDRQEGQDGRSYGPTGDVGGAWGGAPGRSPRGRVLVIAL